MKKGFSMTALVLAALFLTMSTACTKKDAAPTPAGGAPSPRAGEAVITARLLTDASGIDDKSFNAAAWRGMLQFFGSTPRGAVYNVVTANGQDQYLPNIRQATDEGYDLIITTGFTFADALTEVAKENPDQKYLIVDVDWVGLPNVMEAVYAEHEGSFLVGVVAALKAQAEGIQNPIFGFIGGVASPTITKFEVGYIQGIHAVIPGAQIRDYYVGSWDDPALAKTQAKSWYDAGVYVIYSAAGASGNGTIAQAKEERLAGKNVWAIGVDSDQYAEGIYNGTESAVLTSMLKLVETSTNYALAQVQAGTFRGEVITFDLAQQGVSYATTNTAALTPEINARVDEFRLQIVSGALRPAATYAQAKLIPGFPQNLGASD
jgi:basic membrane protein A